MSYCSISVLGFGLFLQIYNNLSALSRGSMEFFSKIPRSIRSAGTKGGFAGGNSKKIAKMLPT